MCVQRSPELYQFAFMLSQECVELSFNTAFDHVSLLCQAHRFVDHPPDFRRTRSRSRWQKLD
jgi:hypothetical protein